MAVQLPSHLRGLVERENSERPREKGFAIDGALTYRPEDTFHASELDDGHIRVVSSIIEVGLLDITGASIKRTTRAIENNEDSLPRLPYMRNHFTYRQRLPMPSISVIGAVNGSIDLDACSVEQTRVFSRRFVPHNERLHSSEAFQLSLVAASKIAKNAKIVLDPKDQTKEIMKHNAHTAVRVFSNLFSQVVSRWTKAQGIPQIYRAYPMTVDIGDTQLAIAGYSTGDVTHQVFDDSYAKQTTPCTTLETWVNMVAISSFFEKGESAVTVEDAEIIASWLTKRKIERLRSREVVSTPAQQTLDTDEQIVMFNGVEYVL